MIFQRKKTSSETWTHPPTSIVNSDFWNFVFFAKPLNHVLHFSRGYMTSDVFPGQIFDPGRDCCVRSSDEAIRLDTGYSNLQSVCEFQSLTHCSKM